MTSDRDFLEKTLVNEQETVRDYEQFAKSTDDADALISENMGSAVQVNLDGQSEPNNNRQGVPAHAGDTPAAPWGKEPSLEAMCEEAGVDFNQFISNMKNFNQSDQELASELGVQPSTASSLRHHFEKVGIDSVEGISG